ncbi:MAG: SusD/RagB family nutrient-binding outer membrane lipoprotein [Mediterranea sp.]|jgi:hypothetical protein|nr:SusD/RagB family nutrient-binding outer membrane lipoprotein [Mediterranea sp.]
MRRYASYLTAVTLACTLSLTSCSDEYMTNLNTDPSKAATIDPNAQLTTAQLVTYGDLGMMETYRSYLYAFTQQLMGCWNTTNYGGRHTVDNNEMSRLWNSLYAPAIKNLVDAQYRTANDPEKVNINAILTIYRVYITSILTDVYGDVPSKEAGLGFLEGNFLPVYDTQEEIYDSFFADLTAAEAQIDPLADRVTGDVIYSGDVTKWKKLANSLRLRFAMRVSNVNPTKARTEFENALAAAGGVLQTSADDALIKYITVAFSFGQDAYTDYRGNSLSQLFFGNDPANNPSYLCSTFFNRMYDTGDPRTFRIARCYNDVLMSATSPDNRIDITDEMIEKGIAFSPRDPGAYSWEPWPTGYDSDLCRELAENNPAITITMAREVEPKLASNFLQSDNPGVVMTAAEVKFLLAEATLKGWNTGGSSLDDLYRQGVRLAMDFLADNYGCDPVTDAEFDAYMADGGKIGYTDAQRLEAINTQAWILHFTNPAECWANQRRSDYPRLKSPADYGFGQYLTGGAEIPVRLSYPVLESSYNKKGYEEALARMGGTDSWHTHVWWDVAGQ